MIGKLARRLGFQQSVSVALIDEWLIPTLDKPVVELAPREGAASCLVDQYGRLQVAAQPWTLELTLAGGARWVAATETAKVKQQLLAPGVLETTLQTPAGPVVQRIAAGVVDGQPVAIIEVENTGGVAIAAGVVVRPLRLDGRGHIGEAAVEAAGITIDGETVVRFAATPASTKANAGVDGDLLQAMPDANGGTRSAHAECRSGGAQVGAVWPVPHTATLRMIVELGEATSSTAAVPSTADVNRGWQSHLKQGLRIDVDGVEVEEDLSVAARSLLTLWPAPNEAGAAITAVSELGFARDASRFFPVLERTDDDAQVMRALARWAQLGEPTLQLEEIESILGRLAQAAQVVARSGNALQGPSWLESAVVALGGLVHQIDQPDVAERIQSFSVVPGTIATAADELARLSKARSKRGVWEDGQMRSAATLARAARSLVIDDAGSELAVLPDLPISWRGRTVDVFGVPVASGSLSFGLRWHGPRPALLWETHLAPEAPVRVTAPGIDPTFSSTELSGEALLADPGWQPS